MKKFLSLALALVMALGIMPAFVPTAQAAEWKNATPAEAITVDMTSVAPILDGRIYAQEWGDPHYTAVPTAPAENADVPDKVEYWLYYDNNYIYMAARITTDHYKHGGNNVGSYLIPWFSSTDRKYDGLLARTEDGTSLVDGNYKTKGAKGQIVYDGVNTVCYEYALPLTAMPKLNKASNNRIVKDTVATAQFEYCDQLTKVNGDGKMQTTTTLTVTFSGNSVDSASKIFSGYVVEKAASSLSTGIIVDGDLSEWGEADFIRTKENGIVPGAPSDRSYYIDQTGYYIWPEMKYYWRYDDNYLYLAVVQGLAEPYKKTDGEFRGSAFSTRAYLQVEMGQVKFRVTHPTKDSISLADKTGDVEAGYIQDTQGICYYEFKIDLDDVGCEVKEGSAFPGYVWWRNLYVPIYEIGTDTLKTTAHHVSVHTAPHFYGGYNASTVTGSGPSHDWFWLKTEDDLCTETTLYRVPETPVLDGVISHNEYGGTFVENPTTSQTPDITYHYAWDDTYLYMAIEADFEKFDSTNYSTGDDCIYTLLYHGDVRAFGFKDKGNDAFKAFHFSGFYIENNTAKLREWFSKPGYPLLRNVGTTHTANSVSSFADNFGKINFNITGTGNQRTLIAEYAYEWKYITQYGPTPFAGDVYSLYGWVADDAGGTALPSRYIATLSNLSREATPILGTDATADVSFNLTSDTEGTLTFRTAGKYTYQVGSNTPVTDTFAADAEVTLTFDNLTTTSTTITVIRNGDGQDTADSNPLSITFTQAEQPTGVAAKNESAAFARDGAITGFDGATMEWSTNETTGYTSDPATDLAPGIYYVRTKASGTSYSSKPVPITIGTGPATPIAVEIDATSTHKTTYAIGDTLDVTGLKLLVYMNDGNKKVVDATAAMVSGFDSSAIYMAQPLTITYTENGKSVTTTYDVTIVEEILTQEEINFQNYIWLMYIMYNQKYDISAAATEGGTISDAGVTKVKYGNSQTYTVTANDGYKLKSLIVDGVDMGAITTYTFEKVKADHTISAVFEKTAPAVTYTDVKANDWFYADVMAVYELGLMNGTGNNAFDPDETLTRATLVTALWRLAGEPQADASDFTDVKAGAWYTAAVNWAAANGIVNGFDGKFNPEDPITREQVMAILHRFADLMNYESKAGIDGDYTVSEWAKADVAWANANGILTGIGVDISDMTAEADRAEIAAYLARFAKAFVK